MGLLRSTPALVVDTGINEASDKAARAQPGKVQGKVNRFPHVLRAQGLEKLVRKDGIDTWIQNPVCDGVQVTEMAGSTGFEPATSGLTVQCANQAAPRARARNQLLSERQSTIGPYDCARKCAR
jgi:hypothetical protein